MSNDPAAMRRDYRIGLLTEAAAANPIAQFRQWFDQAIAAAVLEPTAMTLATVDPAGQPTGRIVLLKGFDERGFLFFTNYQSRKGRELLANPKAGLLFFWPAIERQVRIDGVVSQVSHAESDAYFHTRPRASQIGAAASRQSEPLASRADLEKCAAELAKQYADQSIPLPGDWGGYRLVPTAVEFWQGRESRLHDRLLYTRTVGGWKIKRLSP